LSFFFFEEKKGKLFVQVLLMRILAKIVANRNWNYSLPPTKKVMAYILLTDSLYLKMTPIFKEETSPFKHQGLERKIEVFVNVFAEEKNEQKTRENKVRLKETPP